MSVEPASSTSSVPLGAFFLFSTVSDFQIVVRANRLTAQSTIEEISTNAAVAVPDGNPFLLTLGIPGGGPWFPGDPTNSDGARSLVVLLTPTMIDPAGNRLHPDADVTANPSGEFPGGGSTNQ
jgi:hypothetical protein